MKNTDLTTAEKATLRARVAYMGAKARITKHMITLDFLGSAEFPGLEERVAEQLFKEFGRRLPIRCTNFTTRTTRIINTHPSAHDMLESDYLAQQKEIDL